jgi:hypothetical protein
LLYVRDDDDAKCPNAFTVYRLARGKLDELVDGFLSPCVPIIETYVSAVRLREFFGGEIGQVPEPFVCNRLRRTMKTAELFVSVLLLSALLASTASAEPVRVRLTARVTEVSDSGPLGGKVILGQRVSGLYVYNTDTPNVFPLPEFDIGEYRPYSNEGRLRIAIGGLVFESKQPTQGLVIFIHPHVNTGSGQFQMVSLDNKPLANGAILDEVSFYFNGNGNVTESSALPAVAPIVDTYGTREIFISGPGLLVRANIEAAEVIETATIEVSPASGNFVANQTFDAAIILPRAGTVASARAFANGAPLGLDYPGNCHLQPAVGPGKPSILCYQASDMLPVTNGAPIDWTVEMTDGTSYTKTVTWGRTP